MKTEKDVLIATGGEIKALGNGRVGGWLVRFTDPANPDLEGDFFTKETDFDINDGDRVTVYYSHGQDPIMGGRKLGYGVMGIKDAGVWLEAQLELRDEYERAIYEMAKQEKQGWSSGTLAHLVKRVPVESAMFVKTWPLGKDASLTPTPAAGPQLTKVIALKEWQVPTDLKGVILEATGPKAAQETATANATDTPTAKEAKPLENKQETKMSEKEKAPEPVNVEVDLGPVVTQLEEMSETVKAFGGRLDELEKTPDNDPGPASKNVNYNSKTKRGDDETKAWAHWVRTGDDGGINHLNAAKASNNTTMNITTDADGGYAVPTGHYQGIIARRDESMITNRLGVRNIPGVGTTVNVPIDNEADGEFVSTAESNAYDRDAPALSVVQMTLAKYTKKVDLTVELLNDEDSRLLAFLNDFVGRGMAKTHNSLLLTEVAANGTSLKTFASATVIAVDELESIVFNDDLGPYLDDTNSVGWVMRRSTHGEIATIDDANIRRYYDNQTGGMDELYGFPIVNSQKAGLTAASAKSVYFGNWNFVGYREAPGFTVIRDPYSRAGYGEVIFHYMFRACYDVLIAEAIGYGVHPSA